MREKKSDEKKERKLDRERERKAEKEGEGEKRRAAGRTGQPHGHTSAARLPLLLFCKCRGGHREVTCAVRYNKYRRAKQRAGDRPLNIALALALFR